MIYHYLLQDKNEYLSMLSSTKKSHGLFVLLRSLPFHGSVFPNLFLDTPKIG